MNGLISKEMGLSDILVKNMVGIDLTLQLCSNDSKINTYAKRKEELS